MFFIKFHHTDIGCWSRATRKTKLIVLDNAQHFYKMQKDLQAQNESTMNDWLNSYTKLHSGEMILKMTQEDRRATSTGYISDSTAEFKFAWSPVNHTKKTEQ